MSKLATTSPMHHQALAPTVLVTLFALSLMAFLGTIALPRVDGLLIGSDGLGYYMYVRSIVIDQDIDFANEYRYLYPDRSLDSLQTPTGLTANQYAIGPGLLWMPFFVAGHLIASGLRAIGLEVAVDGYSYLYQAAVCIGSICYGFLGMLLMHRTTRQLFPHTATLACVLVWLATSFIYYLVIEPSMSHMCSFFAAALLLYTWLSTRPQESLRQCYAVGLAGGLVGLVRQPDAALLIIPLLSYVLTRRPFLEHVKQLAITMVGFFSIFWVQMLAWMIVNGSPFSSGYLTGSQGFTWGSPHLLEVLFSTEHGLFLWHPILLFGLIGIFTLSRRDRRLSFLLLMGLLGQVYIIASWSSWSQGDAFGGRMFIASLPIFMLGLAAFLQRLGPGMPPHAPLIAGGILVLWNALSLLQYRLGYISMSGPYTIQALTVGKLEMAADLLGRVLN